VDLDPLIQAVHRALAHLHGDGSPMELGLSEGLRPQEATRILKRMLQGWQQQVQRKTERQAVQADAELASGLEGVFCFLNRGLAFDRHAYQVPGSDSEEEIDLGRQPLAWDPAQAPGFNSLTCRILNRSAGGMGVRCNRPPEEA